MKIMIEVADEQQGEMILELLAERRRQDKMWGEQKHHPAYWLAILGKQVGQLGDAILKREWAADDHKALDQIVTEAIQTGAVAGALVEAAFHDNLPAALTTAIPDDPRRVAAILNRGDEQLQYDADPDVPVAPPLPLTQRDLYDWPLGMTFQEALERSELRVKVSDKQAAKRAIRDNPQA